MREIRVFMVLALQEPYGDARMHQRIHSLQRHSVQLATVKPIPSGTNLRQRMTMTMTKIRLQRLILSVWGVLLCGTAMTGSKPMVNAFVSLASSSQTPKSAIIQLQGAQSEVSFGELDGSQMRIGIIRSRWNDEAVTNLCTGCVQALKDCKVEEESIFETTVPGAFELPLAARFLALSGTVDAIVCVGVLIKGETMHFEYISDAVTKGIMNIGIQTNTPIVFGVLTCLNDKQVKARSTGTTNHGYDWGKTAVEMALLRTEAMGGKASDTTALKELGFGGEMDKDKSGKKKSTSFF